MRKRFFWLLCLAAALALCMLCADALADEPTWTYSKDTHTLTLTGGDFDKDHRWVKESSWSYIGRLVAEPGVRFVGDCRSLFSGLYDCAEMDLHNVDTSQMTSAINLFSGAGGALTKLNIEGWDTSAVTNMFSMFGSCSNLKTLDLSGWDVSHVTDMRSMFSGCKRLVTLNLTGWDLSAVTQMSYMFSECVSLTGLDVSQWNLASAQNLDSLFYQCASLTALDVENWNTAAVTDADSLFYGCKGLTSLNVSKWNTAAVRSTCLMFAGCEGLTELDLSGWNTFDLYPGGAQGMFQDMPNLCRLTLSPLASNPKYNDMLGYMRLNNGKSYEGWVAEGTQEVVSGSDVYAAIPAPAETTTFVWNPAGPRYTYDADSGALTLHYGDFSGENKWNNTVPAGAVKSVTAKEGVRFTGDCSGLFYRFESCESMDLSRVDTSQATDMSFMFQHCGSLETLNLSGWDTANVTDMQYMFDECASVIALDVADWNTANVTNMEAVFRNCIDLESLDVSRWNTARVTNMHHMFYSCCTLTALDLAGWDTSQVTEMYYMFCDCYDLATLTVTGWNTANVTDMEGMFQECLDLETLDLSAFSVSPTTIVDAMFEGSAVTELTLSPHMGVSAVMCLRNGATGTPGWIVKDDAAQTVVSGEEEYAVIAAPETKTTYTWLFIPCRHPNAVTAFDAEGHWLWCPDCESGVYGSYYEHELSQNETIQTVRVSIPAQEDAELTSLDPGLVMGVGNTVTFIGENKAFTYLPDDSGHISVRDNASESLYIPGGIDCSPDDPRPEFTPKYAVMASNAWMEMWVSYEDCGYGVLDVLVAHGEKGKIWADTWFAAPGAAVTFGVGAQIGYGYSVTVKSSDQEILCAPTERADEYTFDMPAGNVTLDVRFYELPTLRLPAATKAVRESAFEGCGAYIVYVNDGCAEIGANAFKDCPNLKAAYIPATVTAIEGTAFDGCKGIWLIGELNSAAQAYCRFHDNATFIQKGME